MLEELEDLFNDDIFEKKTPDKFEKIILKEGERRKVSILFADIKGFTSLSEKMDHEQVRSVIDKLLKAFTICISKYNGYIDKYEGDLVMALFGAKIASEQDTERAIRAGLDMLEALKMFNLYLKRSPILAGMDVEFAVRIGINTGVVTTGKVGQEREGDFTVYGDAVNIASRMESNAPVNSILTTEWTAKIVSNIFHFKSYEKMIVKGKEQPIATTLIEGIKDVIYPNWKKRRDIFIGRERELQLFNEEYRKKDLSIISISGVAGIGKSRLIYHFLKNELGDNDIIDLQIKFSSNPVIEQSYGLLISLVKNICKISYGDTQNRVIEKVEEFIANCECGDDYCHDLNNYKYILNFLAGSKSRLSDQQRQSLKDNITLTIRNILIMYAQRANRLGYKMIFTVDNLYCADKLSLEILNNIINSLSSPEISTDILFFLIYRKDISISKNYLNFSYHHHIELPNFSNRETLLFAKSLLQSELPPKVMKSLPETSGGNPFFIEEWISHINETGVIKYDNGRRVIDESEIEIPDSISALILSRIDSFDKSIKLLIQKASVIGREFVKEILEELNRKIDTTIDSSLIENSIEEVKSTGIIVETERENYKFKNLLSWKVAYNTLLKHNRKILHKIIAELLEVKYSSEDMNIDEICYELADHYEKAEIEDKRIFYCSMASKLAFDNFDYEKSLNYIDKYFKFHEEWDYSRDEFEILLMKAEIFDFLGKWDEGFKLLEKLIDKSIDHLGIVQKAYRLLGNNYFRRSDYVKALDSFNRSADQAQQLGERAEFARSLSNIGVVLKVTGNHEKAIEKYKEALGIYKEIRDLSGIGKTIGNLGIIYKSRGMFSESMECYNKKIEISENIGDKRELALAYGNLGILYQDMGKLDEAEQLFIKKKELTSKLGDKRGLALTYGNLGVLNFKKGDTKKGFNYLYKQLEDYKELGDRRGEANSLSNIGNLHLELGELDKALNLFYRSEPINREINDLVSLGISLYNIGTVYFHKLEFDSARRYLLESLELSESLRYNLLTINILITSVETQIYTDISKNLDRYLSMFQSLIEHSNDKSLATQLSLFKTLITLKREGKNGSIDATILDPYLDQLPLKIIIAKFFHFNKWEKIPESVNQKLKFNLIDFSSSVYLPFLKLKKREENNEISSNYDTFIDSSSSGSLESGK
jgi:class 3 adenylate cyclase/tetratricopeptide (TPR) repeat protein